VERKIGKATIMIAVLLMSMALMVNLPTVKANGTIYIRADGSIDPPTAPIQRNGDVYILTDNILTDTNGIVIERNNMTLDGQGYTLQGPQFCLKGIDLSGRNNITIKNIEIIGFTTASIYAENSSHIIIFESNINNGNGIIFHGCSNCIIFRNTLRDNAYTIYFGGSSECDISENNITSNWYGSVWVSGCANINISRNNITSNFKGISLLSSSNCYVTENLLNNNRYNFDVSGSELGHYLHSVDVSNLVNGKPVYYYVNQTGLLINSVTHPQVGYLALINCAEIVIEGLILRDNMQGLLCAYTNYSIIRHNNITKNNWGIRLYQSSDNEFYQNNIIDNSATYCNQVLLEQSFNITWDGGYPSGGNYWSAYSGVDIKKGPNQDQPGSDGIGDAPYVIDANNTDRYPLMYPYGSSPPPTSALRLKVQPMVQLNLHQEPTHTLRDRLFLSKPYQTLPVFLTIGNLTVQT